ncbi:MAG TPA: hypothetical protein VFD32_00535 [Dehalococcoidia bacterium]|nr:hypothetical protein [Dehalococcoidia bacterium]
MFTRKSKPVEDRVHRVVEATGRTPEPRRDDELPRDYYRASAPGPIPPRRIVEPEPEPEPLFPAPGRDAAPIDQVSSLRQNVMQRVEREPDEESALAARLRRNWLHDRPDPLVLGAVVVVAAVVGLVMLPLLFRGGGSKKNSSIQSPTTVAAQPSSAPASATSAAGVKPSAVPATDSAPIFSAQTPVVTPAAARPAASSPAIAAQPSAAAQPTSAARPAGATQGSGLGPAAAAVAAATPAPGSTPPVTRPARSAPLAPPEPSATPDPGQSLANVVGNAAASQPPPVAAQVGTSSPGQVSIPGVTTSSSSSRAGVAPARSSAGSGSSAPAVAAAPVQPTTIAPSLDTIAAQTSRAAGAAASRSGH